MLILRATDEVFALADKSIRNLVSQRFQDIAVEVH